MRDGVAGAASSSASVAGWRIGLSDFLLGPLVLSAWPVCKMLIAWDHSEFAPSVSRCNNAARAPTEYATNSFSASPCDVLLSISFVKLSRTQCVISCAYVPASL